MTDSAVAGNLNLDYARTAIEIGGREFQADLGAYMRNYGAAPHIQPVKFKGTIMDVFNRLRQGRWGVNDVSGVITAGLLGAGNNEMAANEIIRNHVQCCPLAQSAPAALKVIAMYLLGLTGEESDNAAAD